MNIVMADNKEKNKKENSTIVIEETETDVDLGTEFVGNSDDLKKAVKRDSEKGKVMRVLLPLLVFLTLGGLIGYATWYYTRPERTENTKTVEEKIQTPPVVDETEKTELEETITEEPVKEEPKEETTTADYITYTVKSGDTLSGIANDHGLTSSELADYNNISDVHSLQIGQTLKIPKS